jgi:hypothetical protein
MTHKNSEENESRFYPIVKEALEDLFKNRGLNCRFKILGKNKPPMNLLKLTNPALLRHRNVLPCPDVMGIIWGRNYERRKLVIAEFKEKPRFRDIFQTKGYHELFNARLSLLVGPRPLSESSKSAMAYVRNNPDLLKTRRTKIYCALLHRIKQGKVVLSNLASEPEFDFFTEIDEIASEL